MRTPRTVHKLAPNESGLARWEVSGGRQPTAEVVQLKDGALRCLEDWSLVCDHVHAVAQHLPKVTHAAQ